MPVYVNYSAEISGKLEEYRSKGQKEAGGHRPPTDAAHPDHHEVALQIEAEKWIADEQTIFDHTLSETSRSIADTQQKLDDLRSRCDHLLSDRTLLGTINAEMADERTPLVRATVERMRAEVDLKMLRAQHHITAQAVYPESQIWHYAIIAVLALFETVINAFFYENAQGLLGGFIVALGVAAVNMVSALALGFGFRYKNLRSIDWKVLGWCCFAVFIVLSIYCNALFAAFRSQYQLLTDPGDPLQMRQGFTVAMGEAKLIFVGSMPIADLSSFILLGLGILLALFAFYKGYTLDDRYPGHGKLDRKVRSLRQKETELQEVLRQRVKNFMHHRRADAQSLMQEPSTLSGLATRRLADLSSATSVLINQVAAVQRDYDLVLRAYRSANIAIRVTDPPAYFTIVPDLASKADSAKADTYVEKLQLLKAEIHEHRERYQSSLSVKLQGLQDDSARALKETFQEFLREVDLEAREEITRKVIVIDRVMQERA